MNYTKEEAKQEVAKLIEEFNKHPGKDTLTESKTRTFIDRLFKILGWDFRSKISPVSFFVHLLGNFCRQALWLA
ncbi:MAG TPA: hypothetical protein VFF13_04290 [archaeon]|nr:hypothetical protein [archaeon]